MRYVVTLSLILTVISFNANSQVITEEEMHDLLNSQEIQLDNPIINNFLMIRQISDDNEIVSIQNNSGDIQNNVLVNQNGNGNKGFIEQNGSGLETQLWQYNSSNEANLLSEGKNILISAKQDGDGNVINSYIKNFDLESRSAMLLQEGNNNSIELELLEMNIPEGSQSQEVRVTQNGNGHEAVIKGIDFNSTVEVTQTAGFGGEGMQVEINTSYFSFPMRN